VVQSVQGGGASGTITHKIGQETKSVQIMNDVLQVCMCLHYKIV
jgi:hypothetical protein